MRHREHAGDLTEHLPRILIGPAPKAPLRVAQRGGGDGVTTFALPKLEPLATANGGTLLPIICLGGCYPSRAD